MNADQLIEILAELAQEYPQFNSEREFCCAVYHKIRSLKLNVRVEQPFACKAFLNHTYIRPDIIVCGDNADFVIEMKHFITSEKKSDPPAFCYGVIEDCARLEYIIKNKRSDGVVVGITNCARHWDTEPGNAFGWARNFPLPCRGQGWKNMGKHFFEVIGEKAIYRRNRYSIRLEYRWSYQWIRFGNGNLRYLILKPVEVPDCPIDLDRLDTIPFVSPDHRDRALDHREQRRR